MAIMFQKKIAITGLFGCAREKPKRFFNKKVTIWRRACDL